MDQLLTNLWTRGGWFRAFTPPVVEAAPKGTPILNVPSDVLLLIGDHLQDADVFSLKLACKSTFALFSHSYKTLSACAKQDFLTSIERDPLGKGTVYCHRCNQLHPFQENSESYLDVQVEDAAGVKRLQPGKCVSRDRFSPNGNSFMLPYTHARLVMNRHLYGPGHGIPLAKLCDEQSERRNAMAIRSSTSAKIMDDELFLRRTYVITVDDADVADFRSCTGARDLKLCEHTSLFATASPFRHSIPELQQKPATGDDGLVPCREAPGSCGLCLMDYDITIEHCADETYRIVIRATHQLGSCRSPRDWKWARFTECYRLHSFYPTRPNRRGSAYGPGVIQKRWEDDEREACAVLDGKSSRGLFGLSLLG